MHAVSKKGEKKTSASLILQTMSARQMKRPACELLDSDRVQGTTLAPETPRPIQHRSLEQFPEL